MISDTDVMTSEQRSRCMARIKGSDTKPELLLRKALWAKGLRYRLKYKVRGRFLEGRPDLVFPGRKLAVFVDGCFWHGCPKHATKPKKNADFWAKKLDRNVERDKEVNEILRQQGWQVVRVWEHEVRRDLSTVVKKIIHAYEVAGLKSSHQRSSG